MTQTDVAGIAAGLTKTQRAAVRQWPDAWMAASEVLHVRVVGNVASILADNGILERRSDPNTWGRSQYRFSPLGLAVRAELIAQERKS